MKMKPFRHVSLKIKIFLSTLGVVLLISVTIAMLARWILVSSLTRELELRGVAIAQSIAEGGSGYVLDQDTPNLVSLIFDAAQLGERKILISYIYIVDMDGNVLANTFIKPFPRELLSENVLPPDMDQSVTLIQVDGSQAYDIAVPLKEGIYTLSLIHI
jgi:hypothetical protein